MTSGNEPQDVNAYYSPPRNKIVPPRRSQPPFDPAADDAINYGAHGAVTATISHGFDDEGRVRRDGNVMTGDRG
jgi:predicted metalloendopeptidase